MNARYNKNQSCIKIVSSANCNNEKDSDIQNKYCENLGNIEIENDLDPIIERNQHNLHYSSCLPTLIYSEMNFIDDCNWNNGIDDIITHTPKNLSKTLSRPTNPESSNCESTEIFENDDLKKQVDSNNYQSETISKKIEINNEMYTVIDIESDENCLFRSFSFHI